MGRRQRNAEQGLTELRKHTNTLISIPNDRLLSIAPRTLSLETAFRLADDVLRQAVQSITELVTEPGLINVDFAHIRRLMKLGGGALMTIGQARGSNRALDAVHQALHHPLLDEISVDNAAGIIANFTAGTDLTLMEVSSALNFLQSRANPNAEIVMGTTVDERMEDRVQVILVITGIGGTPLEETLPGADAAMQQVRETAAEPRPGPEAVRRIPEVASSPQAAPVNIARDNLDLPAFMRRQPRYANV
jgi:cell division protein FtsZ